MNEGKNECESEPCHRSQARSCSHPSWCGKRNIEWHASPRAPQLITLSWPYLAPRCFHLSLINCQPRVSFGVGDGGRSGGEGKTPDVFREDGRKLFLSTDAFRHLFCLQMLTLGIFPGSLFFLKIKLVVYLKHPGSNHLQDVFCTWMTLWRFNWISSITGCVPSSLTSPVGFLLWKPGKMIIIRGDIY